MHGNGITFKTKSLFKSGLRWHPGKQIYQLQKVTQEHCPGRTGREDQTGNDSIYRNLEVTRILLSLPSSPTGKGSTIPYMWTKNNFPLKKNKTHCQNQHRLRFTVPRGKFLFPHTLDEGKQKDNSAGRRCWSSIHQAKLNDCVNISKFVDAVSIRVYRSPAE